MSTQGSKPDIVFKLRIPTMAAYGTTKAALEMVMAKYAVLLEKENFTVISVCPGLVDTSATRTQKRELSYFRTASSACLNAARRRFRCRRSQGADGTDAKGIHQL